MGIYSGIRPHELADLRAVADKSGGMPAGERMHALLDAYEEMQDPDEVATLDQVEPLAAKVDNRFDQVKKIHAALDEDEKARQEKAAEARKKLGLEKKSPKKEPEKTAGELVEDIDAKLERLEEALDELQAAAEDLGPVSETKAEYYGALEDISTKQTELTAELGKLNELAEVEDLLLKLAEDPEPEISRMVLNTISPAAFHELAKAWKLTRDFAGQVRDTAGVHV